MEPKYLTYIFPSQNINSKQNTCHTTFVLIAANPHDYTTHDDSNMLKEKSYSGYLTVNFTIAIIVTRGIIIALKTWLK